MTFHTYTFIAPDDFWIEAVINSLFDRYLNDASWYPCGTVTADEAAELFNLIVWSMTRT